MYILVQFNLTCQNIFILRSHHTMRTPFSFGNHSLFFWFSLKNFQHWKCEKDGRPMHLFISRANMK